MGGPGTVLWVPLQEGAPHPCCHAPSLLCRVTCTGSAPQGSGCRPEILNWPFWFALPSLSSRTGPVARQTQVQEPRLLQASLPASSGTSALRTGGGGTSLACPITRRSGCWAAVSRAEGSLRSPPLRKCTSELQELGVPPPQEPPCQARGDSWGAGGTPHLRAPSSIVLATTVPHLAMPSVARATSLLSLAATMTGPPLTCPWQGEVIRHPRVWPCFSSFEMPRGPWGAAKCTPGAAKAALTLPQLLLSRTLGGNGPWLQPPSSAAGTRDQPGQAGNSQRALVSAPHLPGGHMILACVGRAPRRGRDPSGRRQREGAQGQPGTPPIPPPHD